MLGAISGDMIGAPYEFDSGAKTKDFPLFSRYSQFTDDSVMTVAVAEAIMDTMGKFDNEISMAIVESMQKWGKKYPDAGYGGMFRKWLRTKDPKPYGSFGNGSAMRVSAVGWLFDNIDATRKIAKLTANVTHNHPEGIKGAEAVASAIFLARNGKSKADIKEYISNEFDYDLSRSCDDIRPTYHHVESCQETVPEAITAFLEGNDFEDVIRTAVSLGGDCDTLTCISGSIAEAFYGIPDEISKECRARLTDDILDVVDRFNKILASKTTEYENPYLARNNIIEVAIADYYSSNSKENLFVILETIRQRMHEDGHFVIPIEVNNALEKDFSFRTITSDDGKNWFVAFTSHAEFRKGIESAVLSNFIDSFLNASIKNDVAGILVNPWGQPFFLANELIEMIFNADGDVEYTVSDEPLTEELLRDGLFLKRALEICNRNRTELNLMKMVNILFNSVVYIPRNAVLSDDDYMEIAELQKNRGIESLTGQKFTNKDNIRMVPDILKNEELYFFPVFTSSEEMGEYGKDFSSVPMLFLDAVHLAANSEQKVSGIVINAFSESFVIPSEMFEVFDEMASDDTE